MIRAFVSVLVLTFASAAFASETCENLVLKCSAVYQAFDGRTDTVEGISSVFADEHWDEPSLANCASTLYFPAVDNTTVRIYVNKDLSNGMFTVFAGAAQIIDGPNGRSAIRSDVAPENRPSATLGLALNTVLTLKSPIEMFKDTPGNTIYLGCRTSKAE